LPAGEADNVQMIDLGDAAAIDRLIADFRAVITLSPEERLQRNLRRRPRGLKTSAGDDAGMSLRAVVFDTLVPALGGRTRLLLSLEGELTRLPFQALPTADADCLIDKYHISY